MAESTRLIPDIAGADTDVELRHAGGIPTGFNAYLRYKSFIAGLVVLVALLVLVVGAGLFTSIDPLAQNAGAILKAPSSRHLMGTDQLGRDIFSRVLYGGRYTIAASIAVTVIGALFGSILGLAAGFIGGLVDMIIMRIVDLLLAFPGILMALVITTISGPGLVNAVIAVGISSIPVFARLVQGAALETRGLAYTDAAIALGGGAAHIVRRHIIPNVRSQIIVLATTWVGIGALSVAALGFLGLGLEPPTPEWGAILNDGRNFIIFAWWVAFFPGLFISLFVISTNLIGDGIRDVIDPTMVDPT
jgi:ABC-type dipeptide/oligopeptide/nickel transport system permease subunit